MAYYSDVKRYFDDWYKIGDSDFSITLSKKIKKNDVIIFFRLNENKSIYNVIIYKNDTFESLAKYINTSLTEFQVYQYILKEINKDIKHIFEKYYDEKEK